MQNSFKKRAIFFGKCLVTILYAGFLIHIIQGEYKAAKLKRLNYFMPKSYGELWSAVEEKGNIKAEVLREYRNYFKLMSAYAPAIAESHGMLGFCFYYLKEYGQALHAYQRAIERNPNFFWYYYNQGAIYYKLGDYLKAENSFKEALAVNRDLTGLFIVSSRRVYVPIILARTKDVKEWVAKDMQEGYQMAWSALKHIEAKTQGKDVQLPDEAIELKVY